MLTVKEFKDLGVEFVVGDNLSENPTPVGKAWAEEINITTYFDSFVVNFFAWRDNTGVTVEFDGLIDICFEDGTVSYDEKNICFEWSLHDESFISKWRPSLNQSVEIKYGSSVLDETLDAIEQFNSSQLKDGSEHAPFTDFFNHAIKEKPVFTREMADKGELPPVGSEVSLRYKFDSKQIHITGKVLYASLRHCIIDGEHKECHYKMCDYTYEAADTRTPKQKAADEALKDIDAENDDIANVYGVIERMIAAGYKKC